MKSKPVVSLLLSLLIISSVMAKGIDFNIDVARFKMSEDQNFLELYYSIRRADLQFVKNDQNQYSAMAMLHFKVFKNEQLWKDEAWKLPCTVKDTTELQGGMNLIDVVYYQAENADYSITGIVKDLNNEEHVDSVEVDFKLDALPVEEIVLSDIQLASSIKRIQKDPDNVFYKNGLEVMPHPSRLYGENLPMLFYYVECYNLTQIDTGHGDNYYTFCYISQKQADADKPLLKRKQVKKLVNESSVEIGAMNIASLQTGSYYFNFSITDSTGEPVTNRSKKIYIFNKSSQRVQTGSVSPDSLFNMSQFAGMNEDEVKQELELISYIMTPDERKILKEMETSKSEQEFLFNFWYRRDRDKQTSMNNFRNLYLERVNIANEKYKEMSRDGWKTDMGRVFILYGEASNREWFRSTSATKPYEIWYYYHIDGGVEFVFVDISGFKQFRLMHSTKRGEVQNENWQEFITDAAR
jgi:GWxTD domain-containing protein